MTADDACWISQLRAAQAEYARVASNPKLPESARQRLIIDIDKMTTRHIDELARVDRQK